jgi:hypothetical protein
MSSCSGVAAVAIPGFKLGNSGGVSLAVGCEKLLKPHARSVDHDHVTRCPILGVTRLWWIKLQQNEHRYRRPLR